MFIKRTQRILRSKTYTNHLLVESVATERGPRPLARLLKRSGSSWLITFRLVGRPGKLLRALRQEQAWVQKATLAAKGKKKPKAGKEVRIDLEKVEIE